MVLWTTKVTFIVQLCNAFYDNWLTTDVNEIVIYIM